MTTTNYRRSVRSAREALALASGAAAAAFGILAGAHIAFAAVRLALGLGG